MDQLPEAIAAAVGRLPGAALAQLPGSRARRVTFPNGFHVNLTPPATGRTEWFCNSGQHALLPYPGPQDDTPKGEGFAGPFSEQDVSALLERAANWPAAPAVRMFGASQEGA